MSEKTGQEVWNLAVAGDDKQTLIRPLVSQSKTVTYVVYWAGGKTEVVVETLSEESCSLP